MNKQELYGQLPNLLKRLFTYGLLSAVLFLVFWYLGGGMKIWGHFLDFAMNLTAFYYPVQFDSTGGRGAAMLHTLTLENGRNVELEFATNMLSVHMVQVVTFLATWPHRRFSSFLRLAGWCVLFTVLYQTFNIVVQLHIQEIGPMLATRLEVMWEETTWYHIMQKVAGFDEVILRYWAGFPIFLCAMVADYFTVGKQSKQSASKKK